METLLHFLFRLLYHEFAFTYDWVAATVSLGRWKDWVLSVLPFIEGNRILEIGHGPGHLQRVLLGRNLSVVGIDESAEMGRLAKRRLSHSRPAAATTPHPAYTQLNLTRGVSQRLPFPGESFDTVVATFPSGYIYDPQTLLEARRVLTENGRFVILPGATILGRGILDRAMALLFRITGQTPPDLAEVLRHKSTRQFSSSGFVVEVHELNIKSSVVFILVAAKPAP